MSHSPAERSSRVRLVSSQSPDLSNPPIICFHGSGETCAGWSDLTRPLTERPYRVLLYDRGPENPTPTENTLSEMMGNIHSTGIQGPFILIAHSYGGAFAKEFLRLYPQDVAGMVLVETGQETGIDPAVEEDQYRRQVMGSKPLSVIRGNSFRDKFAHFEERLNAAEDESQRQGIRNEPGFKMLEMMDKEDERLKKRQLQLSRNSRYVHVPDCGHGVVRDRPQIVADEVDWVMQQRGLVNEKAMDGGSNTVGESRKDGGGWRRLLRIRKPK
jgi:pimeloyl-ACP methyl ester carboxylesterase